MVGEAALERLAHAAETVLGTVRAGTATLDAAREDALIATLDEARALVLAAVPADADPAPASPAIRALEALNGMVAETSGQTPRRPPRPGLAAPDRGPGSPRRASGASGGNPPHARCRRRPGRAGGGRLVPRRRETLLHALTRLGLHGAAQAARRLLSVDVGHRAAAFADLLHHARRLARIAGRDLELPAGLDRPEAPGEATETSAAPAAPPGLFEAPADIRAAVAGLPAGTALAECLIGPLGPEDVGPVAAALAREPAVLAARLRAVDGGDGLAVLARAADFDPAGWSRASGCPTASVR